MSSDELEKLAAEGRAKQAMAAARERAGKEEEAQERREEYRKVLFGSVSAYARWGWFVAAIPLGGVLSLITAALLPDVAFNDPEYEEGGWGVLVTMTVFFLGFVITRPLRSVVGQRAVAKEEAWVAALPFKLTNYFQTLEGRASDGALTLTITWEDSKPKDLEFISDVFRASGAKVKQEDRAHVVSTSWETEASLETNHHVVEWIHGVMPTLFALHAKWRLKQVDVKASWS
jgi:hypothetical protein